MSVERRRSSCTVPKKEIAISDPSVLAFQGHSSFRDIKTVASLHGSIEPCIPAQRKHPYRKFALSQYKHTSLPGLSSLSYYRMEGRDKTPESEEMVYFTGYRNTREMNITLDLLESHW